MLSIAVGTICRQFCLLEVEESRLVELGVGIIGEGKM
jgi:hypothetical protein